MPSAEGRKLLLRTLKYVRYTENLRQVLLQRGYRYMQWGARLPAALVGGEESGELARFEILLHREKKFGKRMPSVYSLQSQKAMDETNLPRVHFYVQLPY
jgi:hypothetical protein